MTYELVNEKYGNATGPVTIDELRAILRDVFGDTETKLVQRPDGIYEVGGELVAKAATCYMHIPTGDVGFYDDWWYENENGEEVNAVDEGGVEAVDYVDGEWVDV